MRATIGKPDDHALFHRMISDPQCFCFNRLSFVKRQMAKGRQEELTGDRRQMTGRKDLIQD
jgi:hypothetical protein